MTRRAVLDVNILASAGVEPGGTPGRVVALCARRQVELVLSDHIVTTLIDVLNRPYFARIAAPRERLEFVRSLQAVAHVEDPDPSVSGICDDDQDDLVLGTAVAARADYLVTGDKGLFRVGKYRGVRIDSASAFLELIQDEIAAGP